MNTTLILNNVPVNCQLGLDLQFFSATPNFKGIKLIPSGIHVLHWTPDSAEESSSLRMAVFFTAADDSVIRMDWNDDTEEFTLLNDSSDLDIMTYSHLLKYPPSDPPFSSLISHLTPSRLSTILPDAPTTLSSITPSSADSLLLPSSTDTDALRFLTFDVRKQPTWPPGTTGRDLTLAALDHTWFLDDLLRRDGTGEYVAVLAEMQLTFVLVTVLANYSAAEQWKRLLELLATCKAAVASHTQIYIDLLDMLHTQFTCIPDLYFTDLLGPSFIRTQL
ncbi:A1 cistron-splicing factor, partial [Lipomyces arxii]|uniref:A1 cistron-splicing factor n=1 Tax=Lipomyces arxii TaxID=56418 RepID=UPI0034CFF011